VAQKCSLNVEAKQKSVDVIFDEFDIENTHSLTLDHTVTNQGPSMAKDYSILVLIPSLWVDNVRLSYDESDCKEDSSMTAPRIPYDSVDSSTELISCASGPCRVFNCKQGLMEKDALRNLVVSLNFQKNVAKTLEKKTRFLVVTQVCTKDAQGSVKCPEEGKSKTRFVYNSQSIGDIIIDNWKYVLAATVSLIVIFLTFACFKRFRIFEKVRIFKPDDDMDEGVDGDRAKEGDEMELK